MTDLVINIILSIIKPQASREKGDLLEEEGTEFSNMNSHTTVDNYDEDGDDSIFDNDDKSYETSDDSTIDGGGDHNIDEEQVQ